MCPIDYRTCCRKEAWIRCKVMGISRAVEKFGVDRYRKNALKVCDCIPHTQLLWQTLDVSVLHHSHMSPRLGLAR